MVPSSPLEVVERRKATITEVSVEGAVVDSETGQGIPSRVRWWIGPPSRLCRLPPADRAFRETMEPSLFGWMPDTHGSQGIPIQRSQGVVPSSLIEGYREALRFYEALGARSH